MTEPTICPDCGVNTVLIEGHLPGCASDGPQWKPLDESDDGTEVRVDFAESLLETIESRVASVSKTTLRSLGIDEDTSPELMNIVDGVMGPIVASTLFVTLQVLMEQELLDAEKLHGLLSARDWNPEDFA